MAGIAGAATAGAATAGALIAGAAGAVTTGAGANDVVGPPPNVMPPAEPTATPAAPPVVVTAGGSAHCAVCGSPTAKPNGAMLMRVPSPERGARMQPRVLPRVHGTTSRLGWSSTRSGHAVAGVTSRVRRAVHRARQPATPSQDRASRYPDPWKCVRSRQHRQNEWWRARLREPSRRALHS